MDTIVINKNASRNYSFSQTFEAGIVLQGWEVKSLRDGKVDVKDSYVKFIRNEAWIIGLKIDPPSSLKLENVDANKTRKLLLNRRELKLIQDSIQKKGMTCILRKLYWKNNLVKGDISIGKGKKTFDLREDIKQRDWKREKARVLKNSSKAK